MKLMIIIVLSFKNTDPYKQQSSFIQIPREVERILSIVTYRYHFDKSALFEIQGNGILNVFAEMYVIFEML